jgi:hypothetical protein
MTIDAPRFSFYLTNFLGCKEYIFNVLFGVYTKTYAHNVCQITEITKNKSNVQYHIGNYCKIKLFVNGPSIEKHGPH